MLKKLTTATLLASVIVVAGCETMPNQPSQTVSQAELLQKQTWIVTHIGNTEVKTAPEARNIPSLQFDATSQRVSGADGCNRIMGSYAVGADTLSLSQMAGTQMACMNNDALDQKFNAALAKVTHYQVFGKTLKLTDRNGNPVLQFESAVQPR